MTPSRRSFLKSAGTLAVGFNMAGPRDLRAQNAAGTPRSTATGQVDSWIVIAADETVTGYVGRCEFGQGFRTVQRQLIAEELGVSLDRVKLVVCDTALTPNQGVSSGSQGHPTQFGSGALRQALATAREALFQMAADQMKLSPGDLTVDGGVISNKANPTQRISYGRLIAGKQFSLAINRNAVPKDPAQYKVLGTSVPREDIPGKATGVFQYVQNVRVPGMVHGRVVRPPLGAKLVSVDQKSVEGLPGNVRVVVKNDFVGVVADRQWQAMRAAAALQVKWSTAAALPNQATLYEYMRKQPSRDSYTVLADDAGQKLQDAARVLKATYLHPYQMHGSLGTSCAVVDVKGSGATATATLWSAAQGIYPVRDSVAVLLGVPRENVHAIYVEGSGCYGLNGADTVTYDAAILSQAVGKPVRVQLSRSDEMTGGENYGPAYTIDLRAGLDDTGQIAVWDYEAWTLTKGGRPNAGNPGNVITGALLGFPTPALVPTAANRPNNYSNNGNAASSYGAGVFGATARGTGKIRSERVLIHAIASPFFTGPLRSPARLQNSFANESFMDEVAASVKADPVEYRLRHLSDPRLIDVLNAAAKAARWDTRPSPKPGNRRTGVASGRGIPVCCTKVTMDTARWWRKSKSTRPPELSR